jgi:hypothetical protein
LPRSPAQRETPRECRLERAHSNNCSFRIGDFARALAWELRPSPHDSPRLHAARARFGEWGSSGRAGKAYVTEMDLMTLGTWLMTNDLKGRSHALPLSYWPACAGQIGFEPTTLGVRLGFNQRV